MEEQERCLARGAGVSRAAALKYNHTIVEILEIWLSQRLSGHGAGTQRPAKVPHFHPLACPDNEPPPLAE